MDKQYITWEEIKQLSDTLANKIKSHCQDLETATIVAVSRGGLIPAQLIAYKLNIRDVRIMKLISYNSDNSQDKIKDISTDRLFDGDNVYVIDDLADSGQTITYIRQNFPNANICTLLTKDCCNATPDICIKKGIKGNTWIVFPWDE